MSESEFLFQADSMLSLVCLLHALSKRQTRSTYLKEEGARNRVDLQIVDTVFRAESLMYKDRVVDKKMPKVEEVKGDEDKEEVSSP